MPPRMLNANGLPFADYQKPSCPMCIADLPHAKHLTVLEMAQTGIQITETLSIFSGVFDGTTHAIERKAAEAA